MSGSLITQEREGAYGLILADPPWTFATHSERRQTKAAPYAVMSRYDLLTLPVHRLAAPNCALVMWTTPTHLPQGIELMKRWGFDYKTCGSWGKRTKGWTPECDDPKWAFGTGYWWRCASEPYIAGARGAPRIMSRSERNFIEAATREHSRKPEELHDVLERMFPGVRKIELFARARREGWDAFGNETGKFGSAP